MAEGEFLCMLDADDWAFPCRIKVLTEAMLQDPKAAGAFSRFCIVDSENCITGVKGAKSPQVCGPCNSMLPQGISNAGHILRTNIAKKFKFDPQIKRSEDLDFLCRLMQGRCYVLVPEITYAYHVDYQKEFERVSMANYGYNRLRHAKQKDNFPFSSRMNIAKTHLKEIAVFGAGLCGLGPYLISRRYPKPLPEDVETFEASRKRVRAVHAMLFDSH
jgi:hypothetical protein